VKYRIVLGFVMGITSQAVFADFCNTTADCKEGYYCEKMPTNIMSGFCYKLPDGADNFFSFGKLECSYKSGKTALDISVNRNYPTKACLDRGSCPFVGTFSYPRGSNNKAQEITGYTRERWFTQSPKPFKHDGYLGYGTVFNRDILNTVGTVEVVYLGKKNQVVTYVDHYGGKLEMSADTEVVCRSN